MTNELVIQATKRWVEEIVIGLNLCPFAKQEWVNNKVRLCVSESKSHETLLQDLSDEVLLLHSNPEIETSLLIHPLLLEDFDDYNQFLDVADNLIDTMGYTGVYQIASFHPAYRFAGTSPDDAENYTNRSPFPMLHVLREESVEKAIQHYPHSDNISERNIALLNKLGSDKLSLLCNAFYNKG